MQFSNVRAPAGQLCQCNESMWLHRHLIDGTPSEHPRFPDPAWRALAREDHEAAKAQLLREIFP